jgi:ATP-binding cassette, subfamily C (CFTR/MRP), member 1
MNRYFRSFVLISVQSLMQNGTLFPRLIDEYGSNEDSTRGPTAAIGANGLNEVAQLQMEDQKKLAEKLMQAEERNIGAVTGNTYRRYLMFAGSALWGAVILALLTTNAGSQGIFLPSL